MIYVCGPMAGKDEYNFPAFRLVTAELRKMAYEVVCPTEINTIEANLLWHEYLKKDIAQMMRCDSIAYLPGWENSKGASFEMLIAMTLGFKFHDIRSVDTLSRRIIVRLGYAPDKSQIVSAFIRCNIPKLHIASV